jgi:hypothetical protein
VDNQFAGAFNPACTTETGMLKQVAGILCKKFI